MARLAQRNITDVVRTGEPKVGLLSNNVLDTFLRISKQVASEAATTFYGNNTFEFDNIGNMEVFLTGIGSMRKHLRYLRVAQGGYTFSKARPTFTLLKDATSLRTLTFDHNVICQRKKDVVADLKTSFKHLYKIQEQQKQDVKTGGSDVLDIIKIGWSSEKCTHCSALPKKNGCPRFLDCEFDCDGGSAHSEEVLAEAKAMLAKSIGAAE
ncbi:hypothetical protein LTR85_007924 [Meristemomyces frigidus]|nr:hypothetical protein LTR85_007924 [Meristemomyces frigidus]